MDDRQGNPEGQEKAQASYDRVSGGRTDQDISFSSFVVSLATQAMMQVGEIPPPQGVPVEVDQNAAKHSIDLLIMLREKTKGNLSQSEHELLEEVLHSVQMGFVRRFSK